MTNFRSRYITLGFLMAVFVFSAPVFGYVFDDEEPEVTDRVARISVLEGDVQIRRAESEDWEKAVLNLPVVEGDVIAAGKNSRFEIQLNSRNFIRVSEDSLLTLTTLQDTGIAVSLQQGTALFRINELDKDREFFEIDAPKTTIAVQRAGEYFVEAKEARDEVLVAVYDDGEARVYSESSGFTLRSGRSARLFVGGDNIGEWDIAEATRLDSELFAWSRERDETIARRLKGAYYDQYYDRDIYGADELNDYGDWTYDRTYGYVWSPYQRSISYYSDWSPYRYGHWRWVAPYGWVWVNDEPWGWATYHHGRWVWLNGRWFWSPYGHYRYRRSWWRPALVVVAVYNNNICWYPLGYYNRYYSYNRHYYSRYPRNNRNRGGSGPVATNPTPSPTPGGTIIQEPRSRGHRVPTASVPAKGVITVPIEEFGKRNAAKRVAPPDMAKTVLAKIPDVNETPPILPTVEEVRKTPGSGVFADRRPAVVPVNTVKTGAAPRNVDVPLDKELQRTRIFGNRPPVRQEPVETPGINPTPNTDQRRTGAVERPQVKRDESPRPQTGTPIIVPQPRRDDRDTSTSKPADPPRTTPPVRVEQPRQDPPKRTETPRYEPPPRRPDPPRSEPPRRYDPPPQRTETPRSDPPRRSDPPARSDPPKSSPPAPKSEPSKPTESKGKKDG